MIGGNYCRLYREIQIWATFIHTYSNPAMAHDKQYTNVAHSGRLLRWSNWISVISAGGITNVAQESVYVIILTDYICKALQFLRQLFV